MAGRILNRHELRKQADQATLNEAAAKAGAETPRKPARAKAPGTPRPRKTAAKKVPARMRVRWGIFDASRKQIAVFDYNQRDAANERLVGLLAGNKGLYYLQAVKELIPEPALA